MKIRSREVNVVSMSALDLFCCALGAFLSLSLIALPYYGNRSPKEVQEALAKAQALAVENSQLKAEKGLRAEPVDVVIVIDTTGSMRGPIEGLQSQIQDFVGTMGSLSDHARVGIIEYKDKCQMKPNASGMQPTTKSGIAALTTFANSLSAINSCNPELEEDQYRAMLLAVNQDWKASPKNRYIVSIGDAYPYAEERQQLQSLVSQFGSGGGHVFTMYAAEPADPALAIYYEQLAKDGNGISTVSGGSFGLSVLNAIAN